MHPAYSVIIFTTASGAGYGLLFWLSLAHAFGALPGGRWVAFATIVLALALITVGLLASTLHLGHPERAVGAFSQWRSSWLSREGMAAVLTYMPAGLLALLWLLRVESGLTPLLGLLAAAGAAVTVYCTGMIYGSLRTIRQWHMGLVPVIYLALSAATGALLLSAILAVASEPTVWALWLSLISLAVAGALKLSYWKRIDDDGPQYTAEQATGLGHLGKVRPLDPPHTRPNFVMREMGYQVARKHAERLRMMAAAALFFAPALLVVLAIFTGMQGLLLIPALGAAGVGVFVERWLFFAEAEHLSQLYYANA
ncbi:MAG: DmsC/YnfH family molybdoenzyme membrane anchor subunit [Pseudomonadota bacterium]